MTSAPSSRRILSSCRHWVLAILVFAAACLPEVRGQSVWTGAVNTNFNIALNWSGGVPSDTVAGELSLAHSGTLTITTSAVALGDFTVGDLSATDPGSFELTGSTIAFVKTGGNNLVKQGTAQDVIRNALTLTTPLNVNVVDAAGTLELAGTIGAGTLNKTGAGRLLITGVANNPLNLLNARQGTVVLAKDGAVGVRAVTGALNIGGGTAADSGVVQIGGGYTGGGATHMAGFRDQINLATVVTINAFGTLDLAGFSEGIGQLLGSGKVTNSVADTVSVLAVGEGVGISTTFDGVIEDGEGTVAVIKAGASATTVLAGANTFTGELRAASGTLSIAGAQGSVATQTIRVIRGTLLLDNAAANNNDRISDTATVVLGQGFVGNGLVLRRNNTSGVATTEKIGTLSLENGHNLVRFDHSNGGGSSGILPNVLTLEMDHYERSTGGTVAFNEFATGAAPGGYSYFSATDPDAATTLVKILLNELPGDWLVGGDGSSGYNHRVLIGAFGNLDANAVTGRFGTRLMTVETIGDKNYIRPLDTSEFREIGGGATTRVISSSNLTGGTPAVLADDNVKITGPAGVASSNPLTIRIGVVDNQLTGHIAFNSWWQESPVAATVAGSNVRIAENNVVHLGDWAGDSLHDAVTGGSGTIFVNGGLATTAGGPGYGTAYIRGGTLDFGSREAIIYLDVTNGVHLYSEITGSGGLTKTGGGQAHLYGWNSYSGLTTHALNELWFYTDTALGQAGAGNGVVNYATFLMMNGINVGSLWDETQRKDLTFRAGTFYSAGGRLNSWNGDVILDNTNEAGEYTTATINSRGSATMVINGDLTGIGGANPTFYSSVDSGRGVIIQNEQTTTTSTANSVRALNGNFVLDGLLSDIDGRAAVAAHEKLAITLRGYTGSTTTTHNKYNVFIEDATLSNAYIDLTSAYVHLARGLGVDGFALSRTVFRQSDASSTTTDRAGTISALLLGEAGAAYRTQSFVYGNAVTAYSSNSTALMGGENRSGTVAFGHSNGSTTFTFGMNATQDTKSKASGWTNLATTRQASAVAGAGSFTISFDDLTGITPGMLVEGSGIPAGTKVAQVDYLSGRVVLTSSVTGSGVSTSATLSFYNLGNTVTLADVTNLQVGMAVTGTGIRPGTVITAIDAANKVVTLSAPLTSAVTSAGAFSISHAKVVTASLVPSGTVTKTQNFGEARLYQAEGGTSQFYTSFTDGVGYRLDGAVGAITKVGRGTVELMGGSASSDVNGGLNVFGGALVLNYAGKLETFSHVSGGTSYQNNPYQLTLGGGELRLVNEGAAGTTNAEYLRGVMTLKAGNSSIVIKPGDEKTLSLHLGLNNPAQRFLAVTVDGSTTYVQNPDWYWRVPDRFAGATLNLFADTTVDGSANFYYSQGAPDGAGTGGSNSLGLSTILPYATFKYRNGGGDLFVDFAAFLLEGGNTRFVDAAGAVANSANLYNANAGAGAADVTQWNSYLSGSTGYFTDDAFGGANGFSGELTGNRYSTGDASYHDFVGVKAIRFAASDAGGSVITLGGSATRLVLGTQGADSWDGPGAAAVDGGAILVSNSVGAGGARITGGYLTSALLSTYFTTAVGANSMVNAAAPDSRDLIIHNYNTEGLFTIESTIVDYTENHDVDLGFGDVSRLNLVVAGPGVTKLTQTTNYYTGITYVSGGGMDTTTGNWEVGTLQVPSVGSLGTGAVYLNGGRLRFSHNTTPGTSLGNLDFGSGRALTLGGNGGHLDVVAAGTTLTISGAVRSEDNVLSGNVSSTQMAANPGVGDLVKEGAGRVILTNNTAIPTTFNGTPNSQQTWNAYYGLTTVKAGALQVNVGNVADSGILGSNDSSIDGTVVEEGGRLDVVITATAAGVKEWITLDGGTLGTAAGHTDGYIDGVMTVTSKGATIDIASILRLNVSEGFITGSGDILKTGAGMLYLYQNNTEFTGNWDIRAGRVVGITQGESFGSGSRITLGATSATTGDTGVFLYANQGFTTKYRVSQDIHVRANAGTQTRSIGARPVGGGRNQDEYIYDGDLTLDGDVRFVFEESNGSAVLAPTAGELQSSNVFGSYRNLVFNGHIGGAGNISTVMANTGSGSYVLKVTFLMNGDNSASGGATAWTGSLTVGNAGGLNNLQEHYLRIGNNLALTAANKVNLGYNASFQAGGMSVTIGDLKALQTGNASTTRTVVENAANDEGTVRVVQSANTDWDILFQDGETPEWYSAASAVVYSNHLNLTKDGAGTAVLTQLNTYTGLTVVDEGNLQVGRGGTGVRSNADTVGRTGTGGVQVNGGGVLSGTGVVQARAGVAHEINAGGKLAPGDSGGAALGTLFVDGDLVLNAGGVLEFQITSATHWVAGLSDVTDVATYQAALLALPGAAELAGTITTSQHDHLEISGEMDLSGGGLGAGTVQVLDLGYLANAEAGDVFNLIDWAGVTATGFGTGGTFRLGGEVGSNLLLPTLGDGLAWDTSLFTQHGILVVTTVPEPGRVVLLLLAGGMVLARRRRSRV